MKHICLDTRMLESGGIGTYLKALISKLPYKLSLLVTKELEKKHPSLKAHNLILCKSPIYSIQEQLELPFLIPK